MDYSTFVSFDEALKYSEIFSDFDHLKHPKIISLYGLCADSDANRILLVMEYCESRSLDDIFRKDRGFIRERSKINDIAIQIVEGMLYLHGMNVIHGNLHRNNVLVDKSFQVKLSDYFGFQAWIRK